MAEKGYIWSLPKIVNVRAYFKWVPSVSPAVDDFDSPGRHGGTEKYHPIRNTLCRPAAVVKSLSRFAPQYLLTQILGLSLALLFLTPRGNAQTDAVAAFDSGYVETGNPFVLRLAVPQQFGAPAMIDFSAWDTLLPAQNILKQSGWQSRNGQWANELTFITFDSAELALPPLGLVFPGGDTLHTNALELRVLPTPSPDDPIHLRDIKDISREPIDWLDYLKPVWIIAAGLLLFILIVWWLMSRRKKSGLLGERTIRQPAHELALRKLADLELLQHWQNGRIKIYYSELTHIAREYLERRYQIPALESASDEILRLLLRTDMPATLLPPLAELLRWADLAKFAKGTPPEYFHGQAMEEIRKLVEQTKPRPQEPAGQPGSNNQQPTINGSSSTAPTT